MLSFLTTDILHPIFSRLNGEDLHTLTAVSKDLFFDIHSARQDITFCLMRVVFQLRMSRCNNFPVDWVKLNNLVDIAGGNPDTMYDRSHYTKDIDVFNWLLANGYVSIPCMSCSIESDSINDFCTNIQKSAFPLTRRQVADAYRRATYEFRLDIFTFLLTTYEYNEKDFTPDNHPVSMIAQCTGCIEILELHIQNEKLLPSYLTWLTVYEMAVDHRTVDVWDILRANPKIDRQLKGSIHYDRERWYRNNEDFDGDVMHAWIPEMMELEY